MVVAQPHVHVLEEMSAAAQVVFANQTTFNQEVERPVHGGAGSLETVGLHGLQELLRVDMTVLLVDLIKKSQALYCKPQSSISHELDETLSLLNHLGTPRAQLHNRGTLPVNSKAPAQSADDDSDGLRTPDILQPPAGWAVADGRSWPLATIEHPNQPTKDSETESSVPAPEAREQDADSAISELDPLPTPIRIFVYFLATLVLLIGLVGLVLPGIQGILTLALGAALLSLASEPGHRLLRWLLRDWPAGHRRMEQFRTKLHGFFSTKKR